MSDTQPATDPTAHRRRSVGADLAARGVEALLVCGHANVRFLTGFSGSNGTLLVRPDGSGVLATDGRYDTQARREVPALADDVELVVGRGDAWVGAAVTGVARLGLDAAHLTMARGEGLRARLRGTATVPLTGVVESVRTVKDATELAVLARACAVTASAFEAMRTWLRPGLTERAVAHRLLGEMIERGADGPAFDCIVAAGPRGAEPHHQPGRDELAAGDLVTVDFGARIDGYHADCTRTFALGQPDPRLAELYDVVAQAQLAGVRAARAGAAASEVDAACVAVCVEAGHAAHVAHPSGHAVGLEIHEEPILHERQVATLRRGMAITVEPGLYVAGLGGVRIEDVVVVTDDHPEVLTVPDEAASAGEDLLRPRPPRAPRPLVVV